jgi:hypothetical protein
VLYSIVERNTVRILSEHFAFPLPVVVSATHSSVSRELVCNGHLRPHNQAPFAVSVGIDDFSLCHIKVYIRLLATDPEVWVRFPALPDFLRSGGSGTGSLLGRKSSCSGLENRDYGHRRSVGTSFVSWSEFLATDPEVPDSNPGVTKYSEK